MKKILLLALFSGSVVCSAVNFPSHIGMGSNRSTVGKISSYSPESGGLWTGYWKPLEFTVGVQEDVSSEIQDVKAWPNPSDGTFNIDYKGRVKVFLPSGALVLEEEINGIIDVTNMPTGMYVVRTEDGKTIKIIKQ